LAGASRTLDPIAAAEADIAGSRHLIAAVAQDLGQHQRWLAHYELAERRHARRVLLQRLLYQLEIGRRRLTRALRRFWLVSLRLARSAIAFLWRTTVAFIAFTRRVATATYEWLRPRVYALTLIVLSWTAILWAWTVAAVRETARIVLHAASVSLTWLALQSRALAVVLARAARAGWSWTRRTSIVLARATAETAKDLGARLAVQSQIFAAASARWGSDAWTWTRRNAEVFGRTVSAQTSAAWAWTRHHAAVSARATAEHASTASAWTMAQSRALARSLQRETTRFGAWSNKKARHFTRASLATASLGFSWSAPPAPKAERRALVVRRCTALILTEPPRARLPALHYRTRLISSDAVRASP
jgi:hypothetical protein